MLKVRNIHFNYGSTPVLRDISFDVDEGTLCGCSGQRLGKDYAVQVLSEVLKGSQRVSKNE